MEGTDDNARVRQDALARRKENTIRMEVVSHEPKAADAPGMRSFDMRHMKKR